jgi:hypothetical protein
MTVEEWRELERTSEVRHEYIDGYVYAMAGATEAHNRIALNAARELDRALGRGPCIVYASDIAARLSECRFTYPDILVTCEGTGVASRTKRERESPHWCACLRGSTLRSHRCAGDSSGIAPLANTGTTIVALIHPGWPTAQA